MMNRNWNATAIQTRAAGSSVKSQVSTSSTIFPNMVQIDEQQQPPAVQLLKQQQHLMLLSCHHAMLYNATIVQAYII